MSCEAVRAALIAGQPLEGSLAGHVEGCAGCRAATLLVRHPPAVLLQPPKATLAALRGRERRARATGVALAAAAALLVVLGATWARPEPEPVLSRSTLPDTGALALGLDAADPVADLLVEERAELRLDLGGEPLADLSSPTDLFESALLGKGAL